MSMVRSGVARKVTRAATGLALLAAMLGAGAGPVQAELATPVAVAAAASAAVRAVCSGPGELELECGAVPALGALSGTEVELRARVLGGVRADGSIPVAVGLWQAGSCRGELTVVVQVRRYLLRLVTVTPLQRGAVLHPEQVRVERRAAPDPADTVLVRVEDLGALQLRRPLAAGTLVLRSDLEPRPVVHRGDRIVATLEMAGMHIAVTGTALADGAVGARIAVKNEQGSKRLWGVVVGEGAVRIDPETIVGGG